MAYETRTTVERNGGGIGSSTSKESKTQEVPLETLEQSTFPKPSYFRNDLCTDVEYINVLRGRMGGEKTWIERKDQSYIYPFLRVPRGDVGRATLGFLGCYYNL